MEGQTSITVQLYIQMDSYIQVASIQLNLLLQLCEQLIVEGLQLQDTQKRKNNSTLLCFLSRH